MSTSPRSIVLAHFTLKLSDGSTADSSHSQGKPALFRLGDGSLSPELEAELAGVKVGEKKTFLLSGHVLFGAHNPDLINYFSPNEFTETGIPDVGTIMVFTAINGNEMPGIVKSVDAESITVDFNHPLSNEMVTFEIEVLDIDPKLEKQHADIIG